MEQVHPAHVSDGDDSYARRETAHHFVGHVCRDFFGEIYAAVGICRFKPSWEKQLAIHHGKKKKHRSYRSSITGLDIQRGARLGIRYHFS
jgi:hypothetical protein